MPIAPFYAAGKGLSLFGSVTKTYYVKILIRYQNPQITKAHILVIKYKYSALLLNNAISQDIRDFSDILFKVIKVIGIFSMLVVISEAIRVLLFINPEFICSLTILYKNTSKPNELLTDRFNEWLAGYIDGDGYFSHSKKGYVSQEITTSFRDKKTLFIIKQKFGGSVKVISGKQYLRYRQHHKRGLVNLINSVNGHIRNPIRLQQQNRVCEKYGIKMIEALPLDYYNGWLSGFVDADGSIYYNESSSQVTISATNNNKCLLDSLKNLYGGAIYFTNTGGRSFKWVVNTKEENIKLVDYFKHYPLRTAKFNRLVQIQKCYEQRSLKAHLKGHLTLEGKLWLEFMNKWNGFK